MTESRVCSCCGQDLPRFPELGALHLTRSEATLYQRISQAGRNGVTVAQLVDYLYWDRPDGGPDNADKCIHTFVAYMNRKLLPHGIRVCGGRGAQRYVLRELMT